MKRKNNTWAVGTSEFIIPCSIFDILYRNSNKRNRFPKVKAGSSTLKLNFLLMACMAVPCAAFAQGAEKD